MPFLSLIYRTCFFVTLVFVSAHLHSAEILLKNNSVKSGDIVSQSDNFIYIDAGMSRISIAKDLIVSIDGKPYERAASTQATPVPTAQPPVPLTTRPTLPAGKSIALTLHSGTQPIAVAQSKQVASPAKTKVAAPERNKKTTPGQPADSLDLTTLSQQLSSVIYGKRVGAVILLRQLGPSASPAIEKIADFLGDTIIVDPQIIADARARKYVSGHTTLGEQAAATLIAIGQPSLGVLYGKLNSANPHIRLRSVYAIGRIDIARSVKKLTPLLHDPDADIQDSVIALLGRLSDPPPIIDLARDSDAALRKSAAQILGTMKDPRALSALLQLIRDKDSSVREQAAFALGALGDSAAVVPLSKILSDDISFVRRAAAQSLGTIGDPRAIDALTERRRDESSFVREAIDKALGKLLDIQFVSHEKDISYLIGMLKSPNEAVQEKALNLLWLRTGKKIGSDYASWNAWWLKQDSTRAK